MEKGRDIILMQIKMMADSSTMFVKLRCRDFRLGSTLLEK